MESIFGDLPEESQQCVHWLLCQADELPLIDTDDIEDQDDIMITHIEIAEVISENIRDQMRGWTDGC
jgi:hypothetical protein